MAFEDQLRAVPGDAQRHTVFGLALAYLGRGEEAIREGQRARACSRDEERGHRNLRSAPARADDILAGQPAKTIDSLERLVKVPHYISPAWLKIDPNFDPLRGNPRFQKLVARAN